MRVIVCSQVDCQKPATWRHGTWWACDEHVKPLLGLPEMFDAGEGYTWYGTAYRFDGYALPDPGLSESWLEHTTIEITDLDGLSISEDGLWLEPITSEDKDA